LLLPKKIVGRVRPSGDEIALRGTDEIASGANVKAQESQAH